MKSDLLIFQYYKKYVAGTNSDKEKRTFFGSKMLNIEDEIVINNESIQYSELVNTGNTNGFQFFSYDSSETIKIKNLNTVKENNTDINLQSQNQVDLLNNTRWILRINAKKILEEYLFLRLKEHRVFKSISFDQLNSIDINTYIRRYIRNNVLNRYEFSKIDFYVKYENIVEENMVYGDNKIKYNPKFDNNVVNESNLVQNVNVQNIENILKLNNLQIHYNQTKKSSEYKFNYYYNIYFKKI